MRIDAHQHFWTLARGDYGWLTQDLTPIYRDFGPADLTSLLAQHEIEGTILVQAAPTLEETRFMLGLAAENDFIKGVVGWVDFESSTAVATITELASNPKLVGLRPMIHDIKDVDWMLKPALSPAFESLIENNLVFDALTRPEHLPNLRTLLARYPTMKVVIDHGSKPDIASNIFTPWAAEMTRIAADSSADIKLSGLVTEASESWSAEDIRPYTDHLLSTFGPARIIWGSDWPVCTLNAPYSKWFEATESLLADLNANEREAVLGGNALRSYNLSG